MIGASLTGLVLAGSNMDLRPGADGPGIIAFLIVAGLIVVCVLLYRSMRKHLRNIDVDRDVARRGDVAPPDSGAGLTRPPGRAADDRQQDV